MKTSDNLQGHVQEGAVRERPAPDVVLGGQRLKDGDGEGEAVLWLAHHLLGKHPGLAVVDMLVLAVLHPDVPLHGVAVRAIAPLERWLHSHLHPKHRPAQHHTRDNAHD